MLIFNTQAYNVQSAQSNTIIMQHDNHVISSKVATTYGFWGLAPLAAMALCAWIFPSTTELHHKAVHAQILFAGIVLSFLGAVHWGIALSWPRMAKAQLWRVYGWGVLPALLAWIALLLPSPLLALVFLICDLLLCVWADSHWMRQYVGLTRHEHEFVEKTRLWYMSLRIRLTLGAILCLGITLSAVIWR
jgi:hypothetical protein